MTSYVDQANTGSDELVASRSVNKPAGVASGDYAVFWLARWEEGASFPAVTPPSGAVLRSTIAAGSLQTLVYLLKVDAESSFAFTWTGARWSALAAQFFTGVDPALDLSAVPFHSANGSGSSLTTLTVTTVDQAALAWHVNNLSGASGFTHTPPTSFTESADIAQWSAAYRISPGAGSQSASGASMSGSTAWVNGLVALAPAAGSVTGDAALSSSATLTAAGLRGTAGDTALAPAATLAADGTRSTTAETALTGTAALASEGTRATTADGQATTTAALAASGSKATAGSAAISATATLAATGTRTGEIMPFPDGAETITLTGTFPIAAGGGGRSGRVAFRPTAVLVDATHEAIYSGSGAATLSNGAFSIELLKNGTDDVLPEGWLWQVDEQPTGGQRRVYYIDLSDIVGDTVDLSALAPVSAPDGTGQSTPPTGPAGGALTGSYPNPELSTATIEAFDPAGAAEAAQAAAAADATAKVAAHSADTTNVHGIADTTALETQNGAQAKADAAQSAATTAAAADATTKVTAHTAASDPHGDRAYADTNKLAKASNLSDLANAATARTNLGLGNSATRDVGTASGSVAAGDDTRLTNARTPTAHAASHASAGGDAVTLAQSQITGLPAALVAWKRRYLPDQALADSVYSGSAPSISTAQTTTPTSGYIKYAPAGVTLSGSDVTGPFTYAGAGNFAIGASAPDTNYVLPLSKYPNTYSSGQGTWSVEFGTDAQIIQLRFKYISSATMYRLSIDGRKLTDLMTSSSGTTPGSGHMLTVDFGSAAPRRVRFDFSTMPFGGIYIPPTATLWGVPLQGGRLMALTDSIGDGSSQNTGAGCGTWVDRVGRLLGATDVWRQGRGGTGYITAGSYATFVDRAAADVVAWAPDRLIIWGGYNDNGGSQPAISAAAASVYSAISSSLPLCQVYVLGCYSPSGSPATSIQNTDATLRTAAAAAGFPFISPLTGACYNASGTLVATHGAFITGANAAAYIGGDAGHPNDAGHVYLSRRISAAIRELMPA